MAECGKYLGRGVTNFPCSLEPGHAGPCMAEELPRTKSERERWEAEQRHQASGLAEFQGRAQTTAERYTENATAPPGEPRVVRAGSVGEALDRAEVPIHVDPGAAERAQGAPQPTKAGREHDQPMPVVNDRPAVQDTLIVEIERRKQIGVERYGTLLQPFNGRSAVRDAFEEALDLTIYLRQILAEQDEVIERINASIDDLAHDRPSRAALDQALTLLGDLRDLLGG